MVPFENHMVKALFSFLFTISCLLSSAQNLRLEHVRTYHGHGHGVRKVVFSPDGKHFASGGTRGELYIWSIYGNEAIKKLEGHFGAISDLRYSVDGDYIITSGEDGQIKIWEAETGKCVQRIIAPSVADSPVNKVKFATMCVGSGMVYFGGTNKTLGQVKFKSDEDPQVIYSDMDDGIQCGILSPDGNELIFAAGKYLMALDVITGKVLREYNTGSCQVNGLEFSSDGEQLLTWCSNSRVDVRDPANFYLVTSFRSGTGGRKFSNLAFTDDQKYVITGDHASRFNVWDLDKKQIVLDQWAEQGTIMSFDMDNDPDLLLTGSLDKSIKLWQIVPEVVEEKPKKKKKEPMVQEQVQPEVDIVQYAEPIEDVPQIKTENMGPAIMNVQMKMDSSVVNDNPPTTIPKLEPVIVSELPERLNDRRIKPIRQEHRLQLFGNQLTFEIWDAQVIDGDIVSIYVGDDCIVKEYSITATKKHLEFDASRYKRVYVFLHAHNLGTLPPNTVTMTVSDGVHTHQVEMRSDLTGSSALEVTFVEPKASE